MRKSDSMLRLGRHCWLPNATALIHLPQSRKYSHGRTLPEVFLKLNVWRALKSFSASHLVPRSKTIRGIERPAQAQLRVRFPSIDSPYTLPSSCHSVCTCGTRPFCFSLSATFEMGPQVPSLCMLPPYCYGSVKIDGKGRFRAGVTVCFRSQEDFRPNQAKLAVVRFLGQQRQRGPLAGLDGAVALRADVFSMRDERLEPLFHQALHAATNRAVEKN